MKLLILSLFAGSAHGHFSMFDKSVIACNIKAGDAKGWVGHPLLEKDPFDTWWMHGQKNCQSKVVQTKVLNPGGTVEIAMGSRWDHVGPAFGGKAFKLNPPDKDITAQQWGSGPNGYGNKLGSDQNIHVEERDKTTGCALAIAYKSQATQVNPKDFVVFSVVKDCPKNQLERFKVPRLPPCPNDKCICAWFRMPRNGLKNFYMTAFECTVARKNAGTSAVDVEYAIPPRRCLDPSTCNFGPRNPSYYLVDSPSSQNINSPEPIKGGDRQQPSYTNLYGWREGAQNDIFKNTNPRRTAPVRTPPEKKCNGARSRLTSDSTKFTLKSPNCKCEASLSSGSLKLKEGSSTLWSVSMSKFGPDVIRNDQKYKAGSYYFPKAKGPFRIDLNDKCTLILKDGRGVTLWENPFNNDRKVNSFSGTHKDPTVWGSSGRTSIRGDDEYEVNAAATSAHWGVPMIVALMTAFLKGAIVDN